MAAWMIPVAMMAAGGVKGQLDQQQAARQRKAEAEVARWSPWTGMAPQRVDEGSGVLGGMMQGGMAGLGAMQAFNGAFGSESAAPSSTSQGQVMQGPTKPTYSLYGANEARPTWLDMNQTQPQYAIQAPLYSH
jgi:hypothetical protein